MDAMVKGREPGDWRNEAGTLAELAGVLLNLAEVQQDLAHAVAS